MKNRIVFNFTNIASHYRTLLWEKLLESESFEFHFFYGKNNGLNIKEIDFTSVVFQKKKDRLHRLKNFWIKNKILIWQSGVIKKCLSEKIDTAIFLGEFQVVSTWLAVCICKIKGIKVVYWTHGLYGNESNGKRKLRVFFYKTADYLLLYEGRAKELLIKQGFSENRLRVVFNSLNYDEHLRLRNDKQVTEGQIPGFFKNNTLPYVIFVGRLTKVKKLDLLLKALGIINTSETKINLLIIGDGDEKNALITLAEEWNLVECIHFYGSCYDERITAQFLYHATLCVSPGNVGLTAIHSLSFGTPVCTHDNFFNQMPEVQVIEEGLTGCFFKESDVDSMVSAIVNWIEKESNRAWMRRKCFYVIDEFYNPDYQVNVISELIRS